MKKQATIPVPYEDIKSVYRSVIALKELVEALSGQTGGLGDVAVTWQELIDLKLITREQVPKGIGSNRV